MHTPTQELWAADGTDLAGRARELRAVHAAVIGGERSPAAPREVVARSWARVLAAGLDPDHGSVRELLPRDEIERRRQASPLALVHDELVQVASSVAAAAPALMVITDADGVILWRSGSTSVRRQADALGFNEGARWTEHSVGTNAIGTALAEAAPVQLFSAEHFESAQHPWYCTAHPIHDPRTGELLGIVDVSGPAFTLHPAIATLVETTVRLAESQLWRHHREALERIRRESQHAVAAARGPLLIVDDHGWVAHRAGVDATDRIAAPRANTALVIPGLGLCVPERLRDGWLIRPKNCDRAIQATLESDGVLMVRGSGEPWRTPLTPRHAQILTALRDAGRPGLSASALSQLLYGDQQHEVTVRAEVSRLRRKVGALVATRPYRLARGVSLEVRPDRPRRSAPAS